MHTKQKQKTFIDKVNPTDSFGNKLSDYYRWFKNPFLKENTQQTIPLRQQNPLELSFMTPLEDAVHEIEWRRKNTNLKERVEKFLNNDISDIFYGLDPIFYLSRHVATPNYETLRFIELTKNYPYKTVVGQDPKDKFVSNNCLKRALGKMSVLKETTRHGDEIIENFTLLDFNKFQGKPLKECVTHSGHNLVEFHNKLLTEIYPYDVTLSVETDWIDRNHRGDLFQHSIKYLALLLVHGISLEFFEKEDIFFLEKNFAPAHNLVTKMFGYQPLISNLVPDEISLEKDWNSYPSIVYPYIKRELS